MIDFGSRFDEASELAGRGMSGRVLAVGASLTEATDRALRPFGLTTPGHGVLAALRNLPGSTLAQVARTVGSTRQVTKVLLDDLECQGLVRRERPHEHSGILLASLTDLGRSRVAVADAAVRAVELTLASAIGQERWDRLREDLDLTSQMLREIAPS